MTLFPHQLLRTFTHVTWLTLLTSARCTGLALLCSAIPSTIGFLFESSQGVFRELVNKESGIEYMCRMLRPGLEATYHNRGSEPFYSNSDHSRSCSLPFICEY